MPKPNREDVLKWYNSLQDALNEAGYDIDLNNPGDLTRIMAIDYVETSDIGKEEIRSPLLHDAFMKTKRDPDTLEFKDYENPEPLFSQNVQEVDFVEHRSKYETAAANSSEAFEALKTAGKKMKSKEAVEAAEKAYFEAKEEERKAEQEFREYKDQLFGDYSKWKLQNNKKFDPEQDYDQIENLYQLAKEGRLIVRKLTPVIKDVSQIVVCGDGKPGFSRSVMNVPAEDLNTIAGVTTMAGEPAKKEEFERKYGKAPLELPKRPKPPAEVPAPGVSSWLKRIFSFGIVRGDFDRYETYQKDVEEYTNKAEIYDQTLEQRKQELKLKNKEIYDTYYERLAPEYADLYPEGVENLGKIGDRLVGFESDFETRGLNLDDPKYNIYNGHFDLERQLVNIELGYEMHENPQSFQPDGTRNPEESKKYWDKQRTLDPDAKKDEVEEQKRVQNIQVKKEMKFHPKENDAVFVQNHANQLKNELWTQKDLNQIFEDIGKLYGKSAGYGAKIFSACMTQNQIYQMDGRMTAKEDMRNDSECLQDLENLIVMSQSGNKPTQEEYESFLVKFEIAAVDGTTPERLADSLSSIITTNMDYRPDIDRMPMAVGYASLALGQLVKGKPELEMDKPLVKVNGEDVSVSGKEERECAKKLALETDKAAKLMKSYAGIHNVPKQEVKELTTKRGLNI